VCYRRVAQCIFVVIPSWTTGRWFSGERHSPQHNRRVIFQQRPFPSYYCDNLVQHIRFIEKGNKVIGGTCGPFFGPTRIIPTWDSTTPRPFMSLHNSRLKSPLERGQGCVQLFLKSKSLTRRNYILNSYSSRYRSLSFAIMAVLYTHPVTSCHSSQEEINFCKKRPFFCCRGTACRTPAVFFFSFS
jgi:hypothetical protein